MLHTFHPQWSSTTAVFKLCEKEVRNKSKKSMLCNNYKSMPCRDRFETTPCPNCFSYKSQVCVLFIYLFLYKLRKHKGLPKTFVLFSALYLAAFTSDSKTFWHFLQLQKITDTLSGIILFIILKLFSLASISVKLFFLVKTENRKP